jgi:hypothetical protein
LLGGKVAPIDGIEPVQSLRNALLTIDPNAPVGPIAAASALAIAQPENFNNADIQVAWVPKRGGNIQPRWREFAQFGESLPRESLAK